MRLGFSTSASTSTAALPAAALPLAALVIKHSAERTQAAPSAEDGRGRVQDGGRGGGGEVPRVDGAVREERGLAEALEALGDGREADWCARAHEGVRMLRVR